MAPAVSDGLSWVHDPPPLGLGLKRRSVAEGLYIMVYDVSANGVGSWDASVAETASALGCSARSVQRALSALLECNLIYVAGKHRLDRQHGGSKVNCYAVCMGPVRRLRARRRESAAASCVLGLPYDEADLAYNECSSEKARLVGDAWLDGLGEAQGRMLVKALDDGKIDASDAVVIAELMRESPVPVDVTHVLDVIDAYLEAKEDGFGSEDMLRAVRDLASWTRGEGAGVKIYLYVLLRRGRGESHHKALVRARELNEAAADLHADAKESDVEHLATKGDWRRGDYVEVGEKGVCGHMDDERTACALDRLSPRYAGKRLPELADAVASVRTVVQGGCTGEEIVEAYRWYLANGGKLLYALPWLRDTEGYGMDAAWWCIAHLRNSHGGTRGSSFNAR